METGKDMPYWFVKSSIAHKIHERGHDHVTLLLDDKGVTCTNVQGA